jgi:hypothetical protein
VVWTNTSRIALKEGRKEGRKDIVEKAKTLSCSAIEVEEGGGGGEEDKGEGGGEE